MSPRSWFVSALAALPVLFWVSPAASAAEWAPCGPHTPEETVVRVFDRGPAPDGPPAGTSALLCGNRYYGLERLEAEWPDHGGRADGAITRTLADPETTVYGERGNTWTYTGEAVVVLSGGDGQILTARPAPDAAVSR